jgi:hypothetical protein
MFHQSHSAPCDRNVLTSHEYPQAIPTSFETDRRMMSMPTPGLSPTSVLLPVDTPNSPPVLINGCWRIPDTMIDYQVHPEDRELGYVREGR